MDSMNLRLLTYAIAALVATVALAAPTFAAEPKYGVFKVSINVNEDLTWSVPSQTIECGTYVGAGRTSFAFKSKKATKINVSSTGVIGAPGDVPGGGLQNGSMSEFAIPNCNHAADLIKPTSGCGKMSFTPEFSFNQKGSSTFLKSITPTNGYDDKNFDCAHYLQFSGFMDGTVDSCGLKEDANLEIYNNALRDIGGEGITSAKLPFTAKALLKIKKGKKKTYTKKLTIRCQPATETGFSVIFDGKLKAAATFKRVS
jgi:hypothetical protein